MTWKIVDKTFIQFGKLCDIGMGYLIDDKPIRYVPSLSSKVVAIPRTCFKSDAFIGMKMVPFDLLKELLPFVIRDNNDHLELLFDIGPNGFPGKNAKILALQEADFGLIGLSTSAVPIPPSITAETHPCR